MQKSRIFKRFITLCLCVIMAFGFAFQTADFNASAAKTQEQLEEEKRDLLKQQQEYDEMLKGIGEGQQAAEEYQSILNDKINNLQEQISTLEAEIVFLDGRISEKEAQIKKTEGEIKKSTELLKQRLRAMYMANSTSTLNVLLGSKNLGEFFSRVDTVKRISQHDNNLIDKLKEQKKKLNSEKQDLSETRGNMDAARQDAGTKAAELNDAYAKSQQAMDDLNALEAMYSQYGDEIAAQLAEADKEIQRLIAESGGGTELKYTGDGFTWPLPGFPVITSPFGWRTLNGKREYHKGIDISGGGVYGATIIASRAGRVITAAYGWNGGYGNYVIIDHGDGMATVYAHCSSLIVTTGQTVNKGTPIARVGNTGQSYGAHLHFEVRVNGAKVNPQGYVVYGR